MLVLFLLFLQIPFLDTANIATTDTVMYCIQKMLFGEKTFCVFFCVQGFLANSGLCIGGVLVSVLASSGVDRGFKPKAI